MWAIRAGALALAISAFGGLGTTSAAADEAAQLFDPSRMYVIELTLPQGSIDGLAADRDEYQPGTLSLAATDGTPAGVGSFSTPVGMRVKLKGSASYRPLSGKSAFKIKLDAPLLGLRVMTLNNMVEDPSMLHETLAYTAFRGAGVPASRTGYAYVYVNGVDYGIHLNIEALDEVALGKIFGSFDPGVQHLYEGEDAAEVAPGRATYEVDEGDEDDRSDLEALVQAVNSSGPPDWSTRVADVADLTEMTRMWATEKYIGQWDGYAGSEADWLPNNYYLYSDPDGRFQMMPWGNDESWQTFYRLPFDGSAGLMFDSCLADAACAALYRQAVVHVRDAVAAMSLDSLATRTAAMLAPWQEKEVAAADTRAEHDLGDIAEEVADTRRFIAVRPDDVAEWLGEGRRSGDPPAPDAAEPESEPDAHLTIRLPKRDFKVGRAWVARGILRVKVKTRRRGVLVQRVTVRTARGTAVACRTRERVKRPRKLTLRCHLPKRAVSQPRQGRRGIAVFIRFLPAGGKPQSTTLRVS